ncbi:MAG TPA: response regulator [Polyangiaceae bacterium]
MSADGTISEKPAVLIVEDHEDTRELVAVAFERAGFEVLQAGSKEEGLDTLRAHPHPAIVVTDYSLGDGNGLTLVKEARREGVLNGQPIILWTSLRMIAAPESVVVLHKPLTPDRLVGEARELLAKHH